MYQKQIGRGHEKLTEASTYDIIKSVPVAGVRELAATVSRALLQALYRNCTEIARVAGVVCQDRCASRYKRVYQRHILQFSKKATVPRCHRSM